MNNLPAGLIAESAVLIAFFFASMFAILPRAAATVQNLNELPWWAPLGGLTGAFALQKQKQKQLKCPKLSLWAVAGLRVHLRSRRSSSVSRVTGAAQHVVQV